MPCCVFSQEVVFCRADSMALSRRRCQLGVSVRVALTSLRSWEMNDWVKALPVPSKDHAYSPGLAAVARIIPFVPKKSSPIRFLLTRVLLRLKSVFSFCLGHNNIRKRCILRIE